MKFIKTYQILYTDLQACLIFTAKQEMRWYLTGVLVGREMITATNGHQILICKNDNLNDFEIIIPRKVVASLIKKVGKNRSVEYIELHKINDEFWCLQQNQNYELFNPLTGVFPDVSRINIPKPTSYTSAEFPRFNFDYLMDFRKASLIYSKIAAPQIYPISVESLAYIEINDRVHGLLMPMRG